MTEDIENIELRLAIRRMILWCVQRNASEDSLSENEIQGDYVVPTKMTYLDQKKYFVLRFLHFFNFKSNVSVFSKDVIDLNNRLNVVEDETTK